MKKNIFSFVFVMLLTSSVFGKDAIEKSLVDQIPADKTVIYVELDLNRLLNATAKSLEMIYGISGKSIADNVVKIKKIVQQGLAEDGQFKPKIFDELDKLKIYFVGLRSDKDSKDIEDLIEPFLVLETSSTVVAENFSYKILSLLVRHGESVKEESVGSAKYYINGAGRDGGFGHVGKYFLAGTNNLPRMLMALDKGSKDSFSASTVYQSHKKRHPNTYFYAYTHMQPFINLAKKIGIDTNEVDVFMRVSSFDKIKYLELNFSTEVKDEAIVSSSYFSFHYDTPLSTVMKLILNGGAPLSYKGDVKGLSLMFRMGVSEVFDEFISEFMKNKSAEEATLFWNKMNQMKKEFGVDFLDVSRVFSGDFYLFMDVIKKDYVEATYDFDERKMKQLIKNGLRPEFECLAGLKDVKKAKQLLSDFYNSPTVNADAIRFAKKKYKENDIYVVSVKGDAGEGEIDGLQNFAIAIVGQHIKIGSWKSLTSFIDNYDKQGDRAVDAWVQQHEKATWITKIGEGFNERFSDMARSSDEIEQVADQLQKEVAMVFFPFTNDQLRTDFQGSMYGLIKAFLGLVKQPVTTSLEGIAEQKEGYYKVKITSTLKKPQPKKTK